MMQIRTLGAGGGTIAWIGPDGLLKAGPQSAGADPGPACYGLGGQEPTVTDANVVLGYLDPDYFVGGKIAIHPGLSEEAIRRRIAEPLGLTLEQAALGIIRVVNVNMEVGLRLSLLERGQDHRTFALVAFGGAGPLSACDIAAKMGMTRVVVPIYPGLTSAFGALIAEPKVNKVWSKHFRSDATDAGTVDRHLKDLVAGVIAELRAEGFAGEPEVVQPIAMTFDDRGRLWVVENLSYPNWSKDGTGKDRVIILEDTDHDGTADKRTVFFDKGANLSGIEYGFGGIWLTSIPNLLFIPQSPNPGLLHKRNSSNS